MTDGARAAGAERPDTEAIRGRANDTPLSDWRAQQTYRGFCVRGPLGPDGTPVQFKERADAHFVWNGAQYVTYSVVKPIPE